jgi:hypothetical protein
MLDAWFCNRRVWRGIISPHHPGARRNDMSKLHEDSAFIACLALLFATFATATTVLALFQAGSTPLV